LYECSNVIIMATKSKQPRKQRKSRYNAPLHERRHFVSAHISKELRAKLGTKKRAVPLRKGDRVKIMKGEKRGHTGKIIEIDLNAGKVYVEGVVATKAKGTEIPAPIDASNLLLLEGDFDKKGRQEVLERSSKVK